MKKIDTNLYRDYTIVGDGWSITLSNLGAALKQFNDAGNVTLYGNRIDGGDSDILNNK